MSDETFLTMAEIDRVVGAIRERTEFAPKIGLILGSGLGPLADEVEAEARIAGKEIEGWPRSTVEGHAGRLVLGRLEGQAVLVLQGRVHYYEGQPMSTLGMPVRVMQRLGAEMLIVTNAAGGINQAFDAGDLMLITDHINLLGMAGQTPLRGPNLDDFGPRFPDMSRAYDRELLASAAAVAEQENVPCHQGVYICLAGPSFETPADLRFLKGIGADAVGMSTVPEVTVARHGGMRVLGISGITNKANMDGQAETTHEEVLEASRIIVPRLSTLIKGVLRRL
jgi:purine-nucleoside phosphorylase